MLSLLALSTALVAVSAAPSIADFTNGFENPYVLPSVGGHATCIVGTIPVSASAMNTELKYPLPANQSIITETIVEFLQVNATLPSEVIGSKHNISGTYSISGKLCYPASSAPNASLIQFLTHGVGFDKSYWDFFSSAYSYVDAAAIAGYTTFSYDRLGVGSSSHPDPIQVVQAPLETAIAHSLITMLQDFDAVVLTGFSVDSKGQGTFFAGLDLTIARLNSPARFALLENGYLISNNIAGNQFGFFRLSAFDHAVLAASEATKQTFTVGELFTNMQFMGPAPGFKGPITIVDGENDLPFCQSNCLVPENKAAAVRRALYPNAAAGSDYYIAKGAGHGLNLHYVAGEAYQHIFQFIKKNGF